MQFMRLLSPIALFAAMSIGLANPVPVRSEVVHITCPPELKMLSSNPPQGATGVPPDAPITITWDKRYLENLSNGVRDLKPTLESVNIAGGRYGMGTLLTTEWGIGGNVIWKDNEEVITPEAPLEPGTQYRLWTYFYMTIRDDQLSNCPRIGGEIIFRTTGIPPEDGNPVRDIDLSTLYHGDNIGKGTLRGVITVLNLPLHLMTIKDESLGHVTIVAYKGIPLLRHGDVVPFESFQIGDIVEVTFTGGRAVMIQIKR